MLLLKLYGGEIGEAAGLFKNAEFHLNSFQAEVLIRERSLFRPDRWIPTEYGITGQFIVTPTQCQASRLEGDVPAATFIGFTSVSESEFGLLSPDWPFTLPTEVTSYTFEVSLIILKAVTVVPFKMNFTSDVLVLTPRRESCRFLFDCS